MIGVERKTMMRSGSTHHTENRACAVIASVCATARLNVCVGAGGRSESEQMQ